VTSIAYFAREASLAAFRQLREVCGGPALIADAKVDEALLVVGVGRRSSSGKKPRSSAPNTCSSIITSSCGQIGEQLQLLQSALGEHGRVRSFAGDAREVHGAGVVAA
jgi:hypothetical protein